MSTDTSNDTTTTDEAVIPGKGKRKEVKVNKEIRKDYSDAEIKKLALEVVKATQDKEKLKDEFKVKADEHKAQISALDSKIEDTIGIIGQGFQYETVECEMVRNFDTQLREWYLNGELIETEPLSAKDHQLDIEDAEKHNKEEAARIDKEEAAKKTAELNAQAEAAAAENEALSDEDRTKLVEFTNMGDEEHKAKNYDQAKVYYTAALKYTPNDKNLNNKLLKTQNWIDKIAKK